MPAPTATPRHATPGLRERKKAQTRARLERATVELALERNLDSVTIDEICARVPVSHRTFFNYFDCKEDALFGLHHAWSDREAVERHLAERYRGDLVATLAEAVIHGLPTDTVDPSLHEARMLIASRNPGLIRRRLSRLDDVRTGLVAAVAGLMEHVGIGQHAPSPGTPSPVTEIPRTAQAEVLVVVVIGAARIALREWADAGAVGTPQQIAARARAIVHSLPGLITA